MAFDAFLKIDGIDGESTDKVHPGEIEIQSFSWGVTNTGSAIGGGGGAGKASFSDLNFASSLSKASPNLMLACATGKHIASATLTCRKSGGNGIEFLKIKLSDILVSSYQSGGSTGADLPEDSFGLNFTKIDFLYTVAKTGETVETAFDLRENKA
jgi:type VI secretion system secreted protein Hcp